MNQNQDPQLKVRTETLFVHLQIVMKKLLIRFWTEFSLSFSAEAETVRIRAVVTIPAELFHRGEQM